jgi:hypothetical protein
MATHTVVIEDRADVFLEADFIQCLCRHGSKEKRQSHGSDAGRQESVFHIVPLEVN